MYRVDREMDIREKLSICPLLAELPLRQTDVSERSFRAGQIISDRLGGIPAVGMILSGRVDAYSVALDGKDVLLNSLTSGECFGVCNLLAKAELKTVLRCAEDTTILYVTKPVLLSLMKQKVDFAVRYAEMCNQKIQFLIHRIELLTMQSCRGRVIAYLLEKKDASNLVHVTVSREDLARQLGVSRAALFRELSTLQGRNAISAEGNTIGFIVGIIFGTWLAALSAHFRRIEELLAPAMLAVRSIPVASFIILALILFSSHNLSVLISFLMVLPIIYASVLEGIRAADHQLLEMAKLFRVPPVRCIRYVYLPQVMPYFHSACGSALGLCWKAGIAAEVIGMPRGSIGECLQQAKVYLDTPDLFAWTLVIVVISLAFEKVFIAFMNACAVWLERI